ncbi:MAG TPA: NAD(P)/FAD-dependent oxidoreductase [Stellaceae bacterium]|nr:NAD(P)/FAD-dependent oxidoreductase [Stellaceae bacterium]
MDKVECVVVGAGIIGLAIARALALAGREVLVLEKERAIGTHTSSRNSEVIHAGLYYPVGSFKARFCVEGRKRLYEYCAERGVMTKRVGKLVVAAADEIPLLANVIARARANGVDDLELLDEHAARELEPAIVCAGAFLSPSTGIIDSHGLMLSYQGEAEDSGTRLALRAEMLGGKAENSGFVLEIGGQSPTKLACEMLVNAAGLWAPQTARRLKGVPPETIPHDYYCRGVYFTLAGKAPFRRLVYPAPEHAGLGVHYTVDLAGQGRFGPDTEWIDGVDYTVETRRGDSFYAAIRKYWPGLPDGALAPGYAGIRPKISARDEPNADFLIQGAASHGIRGLVNLYGIESPGLTSSLPIADEVLRLLNASSAASAPPVQARPAP